MKGKPEGYHQFGGRIPIRHAHMGSDGNDFSRVCLERDPTKCSNQTQDGRPRQKATTFYKAATVISSFPCFLSPFYFGFPPFAATSSIWISDPAIQTPFFPRSSPHPYTYIYIYMRAHPMQKQSSHRPFLMPLSFLSPPYSQDQLLSSGRTLPMDALQEVLDRAAQ